MTKNSKANIEILGPCLLNKYPKTVSEVDLLCSRLGREIGWHYILDLVYILEMIDLPPGARILDAGAGNGIAQFALAARGYNVISVDFSNRKIPLLASLAFSIRKIEGQAFEHEYISYLESQQIRITSLKYWKDFLARLFYKLRKIGLQGCVLPFFWLSRVMKLRRPGRISYCRSDMSNMGTVASDSVDAVVSVSAVEHMDQDLIAMAVKEFKRVLKPEGKIVVTTSAAKSEDWFHQPSKGWCFSEGTIRKLFELDETVPSNYNFYDELTAQFRNSEELQRRIPAFYKLSGENGMPWGVWDPKYLPVGIKM